MDFNWEQFFRHNRLSESSGKRLWLERIGACGRNQNRLWALRFMALVHFFERREQDANNGKAARRVLKTTLEDTFRFESFYNNQKLKDGLQELGVRLRVDRNDHIQYIRTIMYYSGWMYVAFAHQIGKVIGMSSWNKVTDHDFLSVLLGNAVQKLNSVGDEEQSEAQLSLEDVVAFFQSLARLYLRYNAPFTVEDVQELAPLKRSVAQRIIDEMCKAANEEGVGLKDLETLPQIDLNTKGQVVFSLPKKGHFKNGTRTVVFLFRERPGTDVEPFAHRAYNVNSDDEHVLSDQKPVLLNDGMRTVRSIARLEPGGDQKEQEVLPQVFFEAERTHLLLRLRDSDTTDCGYELDSSDTDAGIVSIAQKLECGRRYKVVPINGNTPEVVVISDDGRINIKGEGSSADGSFIVPANAEAVSIGTEIYEVKTAADTYLNLDDRLRLFDNPGRLFFEEDCYPFTDACKQDGVVARYVSGIDDQCREFEIPFDVYGNWRLPAEVLWKAGSLEMWAGDKKLFRRAITFVDKLDLSPFGVAFDIEDAPKLEITVGDEKVSICVPKRVTRVIVPYKGFRFSIPVKRTGVYFEFNKQIIPIPLERPGQGRIHDIARKDFDSLRCRIAPASEFDIVQVARGNTNIVRLDERSFIGKKLLMNESLQDSDSDYYAICISHDDFEGRKNAFYKFHVYDPTRKNVAVEGEQRHSVVWKHDEATDDLVLTYWLPYSDQNRQKHLVFFPAHKQDERAICFAAEPRENYIHETDPETGRCKETIRIPHFFRESIDWGRGLICFVANKQVYFGEQHGYEVLTSGFLLKAPPDKVTEITNDPYGLRAAFAGDENCHEDRTKIVELLMSVDPAVQQYVSSFLDRMKDAVSELNAFKYLNSYWNQIVGDDGNEIPSGYAFMAGSYFSKVFAGNTTAEAYKGLWSPKLIYYPFVSEQKPFPLNAIKPLLPHMRQPDEMSGLNDPGMISRPLMSRFWGEIKKNVGKKAVNRAQRIYYTQNWTFSYPQLAEAVRLKFENGVPLNDLLNAVQVTDQTLGDPKGVIEKLYQGWEQVASGEIDVEEITSKDGCVYEEVHKYFPPHGNMAKYSQAMFRPVFDWFNDLPYLFYGGYEDGVNELHGNVWEDQRNLDDETLDAFVKIMGKKLHEWRKNPTLESAQSLRKTFSIVEQVDACMAVIPGRPNPVLGLMDAIENEAWRCHAEEKVAAPAS